MTALLLCLLIPPQRTAIEDRVDGIEHNTTYRRVYEAGEWRDEKVFVQLIFWEWDERLKRYTARAFRVQTATTKLPEPAKLRGGGPVVVIFWDDKDHRMRIVTARFLLVTESLGDPEMADRDFRCTQARADLTK